MDDSEQYLQRHVISWPGDGQLEACSMGEYKTRVLNDVFNTRDLIIRFGIGYHRSYRSYISIHIILLGDEKQVLTLATFSYSAVRPETSE
jgi:hypothetical protein